MGFAGLTFLILVFPFDKLKYPNVFCQHEVEIFNRIYFYNAKRYLPFTGLNDLFDNGPNIPFAYREWLDDIYNAASWWVTYIVYERIHNMKHIYFTHNAEFATNSTIKQGPGDIGFFDADNAAAIIEIKREAQLRKEINKRYRKKNKLNNPIHENISVNKK